MPRISKIFNSVGLSLGIIGVLIIFKYGPPQPSFQGEVYSAEEDNTPIDSSGKTVAQYREEVKFQKELYDRNSKTGLALIMLGFTLQLVAVWIPENKNGR